MKLTWFNGNEVELYMPDRPQNVGWVRPTGRNAISDGGLHKPYEETAGPVDFKGGQKCYLSLNQAVKFTH